MRRRLALHEGGKTFQDLVVSHVFIICLSSYSTQNIYFWFSLSYISIFLIFIFYLFIFIYLFYFYFFLYTCVSSIFYVSVFLIQLSKQHNKAYYDFSKLIIVIFKRTFVLQALRQQYQNEKSATSAEIEVCSLMIIAVAIVLTAYLLILV